MFNNNSMNSATPMWRSRKVVSFLSVPLVVCNKRCADGVSVAKWRKSNSDRFDFHLRTDIYVYISICLYVSTCIINFKRTKRPERHPFGVTWWINSFRKIIRQLGKEKDDGNTSSVYLSFWCLQRAHSLSIAA